MHNQPLTRFVGLERVYFDLNASYNVAFNEKRLMELDIFNYENKQIRTALNEKGEVVFVAKDVCDILKLENVSKALMPLDESEKGITIVVTRGGNQKMLVINKSGVYSLESIS